MPAIKHTPGPWAAVTMYETVHVTTYRDNESPQNWIPEESGAIIASHIGDHTEQRTRGNELANAKLMAAAPDLLEALQCLLVIADAKTPEEYNHVGAARAAIRKATE